MALARMALLIWPPSVEMHHKTPSVFDSCTVVGVSIKLKPYSDNKVLATYPMAGAGRRGQKETEQVDGGRVGVGYSAL